MKETPREGEDERDEKEGEEMSYNMLFIHEFT